MKSISQYIREVCLGGYDNAFDAVQSGADPVEIAKCVRRVLLYAPMWFAQRIAMDALRQLAEAGLRNAWGTIAAGIDAPLFSARYADENFNELLTWDTLRLMAGTRPMYLNLDRDLHGPVVGRDTAVIMLADGSRQTIELACQFWSEAVAWSMAGYNVIDVSVPPDAAPRLYKVKVAGRACTGALQRDTCAIGFGIVIGHVELEGEPGVTGRGYLVYLNDACGDARTACYRGVCISKDVNVKSHKFVANTDAFRVAWIWTY